MQYSLSFCDVMIRIFAIENTRQAGVRDPGDRVW